MFESISIADLTRTTGGWERRYFASESIQELKGGRNGTPVTMSPAGKLVCHTVDGKAAKRMLDLMGGISMSCTLFPTHAP